MGGMVLVMFLMMLSGLLVIVGIILLVIWGATYLFRNGALKPRGPIGQEDPLIILQRRYARGEIQADEYERIRSDLQRGGKAS